MKKVFFAVMAAILICSCSSPADLVTLNRSEIEKVRKGIRAGKAEYMPAYEALIQKADGLLSAEPLAVTLQEIAPPSGDKHDYMSRGTYWWPDPTKPDGLPYIRRDGVYNPENQKIPADRYLKTTCANVNTLTQAFYFSRDEKYAEKAAELLRVFFLNPETKMNPHLKYGQAIPGICEGRSIGIIDTHILGQTVDALILLEESKAWTDEDAKALKAWFKEYNTWMLESEIGKEEGIQKNNHGTAYDFQVCAYAIYYGEPEIAVSQLENVSRDIRMDQQFPADASQPLELARTNSWGYSTMNTNIWIELIHTAKNLGIDIWQWRNKEGVGIKDAIEWYFPYIRKEKPWVKEDISKTIGSANLHNAFRCYCKQFCPEKYDELIATLDSYTNDNYDFDAAVGNLLYPIK